MTWPMTVLACVIVLAIAGLVAWRWHVQRMTRDWRAELEDLGRRLDDIESEMSFRRNG